MSGRRRRTGAMGNPHVLLRQDADLAIAQAKQAALP